MTGSLVSTLSPSLLNEFRFQWAREDRPRPYDGPLIAGQSRPLPDTAFDFGSQYRFGEPFFIPVDYFDERIQFNENVSVIKGRHSMKFGAEFNRVHSNQTFRGFQNGRYIFGSTDGFLNYTRNPRYVECSDGSTSEAGACPSGASITGPLLLFLQQFGVGGLTSEEAGTQDIPQTELAFFAQDKWQPNAKLTIQYGLRWEMQKEADPITPPDQVFYSGFIGKTVTNSYGTFALPLRRNHPVGLPDVAAPRGDLLGRPGRRKDGRAAEQRALLRPRPGPEPRLLALHERLRGPRTPSARASSTASASPRRRTRTCCRRRRARARRTTRPSSPSTRASRTRGPGPAPSPWSGRS